MRPKLAAAAAFGGTSLWSVAAMAHSPGSEGGALTPLASSPAVGFIAGHTVGAMAALAAAALLLTAQRGRKGLGTALIALTLWLGFQAAVHSVHHLGQPFTEARCPVASSATHGAATLTEASASVSLLLAHATLALDPDAAASPRRLPATHEGRAPPRLTL
jgi:hypothetical protein